MNVNLLIVGLIALLIGLIGLPSEWNKSWRKSREEGWNYTRTSFVMSSYLLVAMGIILVIYSLFDG